MRLYEYINACMREFGIEKVFGVPGSLIMPVWQNMESENLVLCSHEQEASYLATGYAKMSKKPVMVLTTGGPGVTNCISGIAGANLDSLPVIYISGRTPLESKGLGLRQEEGSYDRCYESTEIMKTMTKSSVYVEDIEHASERIFQAFQCAVTKRRGSVHLSIPVDLQEMELPYAIKPPFLLQKDTGNTEENPPMILEQLLGRNKKRIIVMGWGCWLEDVYKEVYCLAERIQAPVLLTVKAYCCMNGNEWVLGKMGYGYNAVLSEFIKTYHPEEVLVFGSSMSIRDFSGEFMEDIEKAEIHVFTMEAGLARKWEEKVQWHEISSLKNLFFKADFKQSALNEKLKEQVIRCQKEQSAYWDSFSGGQQLSGLCRRMPGLLDGNITVTADAGNHLLEAAAYIWPGYAKNLFLNDGIRAMGSGICETAGMAFADAGRHYIAVTGDGCMLMNGNIMYIVRKYCLPIVFLVINNSSLGRVRAGQMISGRIVQSDLGGVDFVRYAEAFGIEAYCAADVEQCMDRLVKCLKVNGPALIEMQVSKDEIPAILRAKGVWN